MKILRYILKGTLLDKVDFILLLVVIAFLVKDFERYAFLSLIAGYIIFMIYRMSTAKYNLNEYVTDRTYRGMLKLYPIPGVYPRRRRTIFEIIVRLIFWIALIGILFHWAIT